MRKTLVEHFNAARDYLDTDALNFSDNLCRPLLREVWFQALNMEREWRFLRHETEITWLGSQPVQDYTAFAQAAGLSNTALRLEWLRIGAPLGTPLPWIHMPAALTLYGDNEGWPEAWAEVSSGEVRGVRLFPTSVADVQVRVSFTAEPLWPERDDKAFDDLPVEFDDALQMGLRSQMFLREEDTDLYQIHRQTFLEQMGSIRSRWKESQSEPLRLNDHVNLTRKAQTRLPSGF